MNSVYRGFTLLEVLVALAVWAIAMAALIQAASDSARAQAIIQERTIAGWVAENIIVAQQLDRRWPDPGSRFSGEERMAGREWRWSVEVYATPEPSLRRFEVRVRPADTETTTVQLNAFLSRSP